MRDVFECMSGIFGGERRFHMIKSPMVLAIAAFASGCVVGGLCAIKKYDNIKEKGLFEQYQKQLFDSCLMENRENAIGLDGYFLRNNYRNVVVYGLGMYKEEFLKDVTKSTFDNIYYADKSAQTLSTSEQKIYGIEELTKQDFYDVIVVTSYNHAKEIEAELRATGIKKDIISYSDLVINAPKER